MRSAFDYNNFSEVFPSLVHAVVENVYFNFKSFNRLEPKPSPIVSKLQVGLSLATEYCGNVSLQNGVAKVQQLVFSKESSSCSSKCRLRAEIFIKFDTDQLCQLIMRKLRKSTYLKIRKILHNLITL